MLKAILYYLLLIAEFVITLFIGAFALGLYLAFFTEKERLADKSSILSDAYLTIMGFSVLGMLIVWFTFYKSKFSKFTLGKVLPSAKWKTMLYSSLPLLGFTMAYYAILNLFQIHFLPKTITEMGFLRFIPFAVVGSFFNAYVFYGAIQEELIKSGKKKWVQLLTLCLMMLPACTMTVSEEGNISWEHLGIMGIISTCYSFWIYGKTRSTIILFVVYFVSNLVPSHIESAPMSIGLMVIGVLLIIYGMLTLRKELPEMIEEDTKQNIKLIK